MSRVSKISPCLWFDRDAEDAAKLYISIFDDSRIVSISRYGKAGFEVHGMPEGTVLTVSFELEGQTFRAMNGGPRFELDEAISFQVDCATQAELDRFWDRLSEGGDPSAQQCGWLKDRFGVSWQIVPHVLPELLLGPDEKRTERVMQALLAMKKPDIAALERAWEGR
jgi:predicted 3-demethylubiquinone-9 3-methyltransferase (glyoxalase superfamily)